LRFAVDSSDKSVSRYCKQLVSSKIADCEPWEPMAHKFGHQKVIGSLLHLAWCTRPDIALPVGALAAYASAPCVAHHEALLNVVRYVRLSAGRGLTFGGGDKRVGF
jgi:hypothetical protein